MAKIKKIYACTNCGATSSKWEGKCPSCEEWNTFVEEIVSKPTTQEEKKLAWKGGGTGSNKSPKPIALPDIVTNDRPRLVTPDGELNRVLGGGIVSGSLVLIGGQPGIGKSTLLLQVALRIPGKILYVSGEESDGQIKMRAERIGGQTSNCFILTETNVTKILNHGKEMQPDLMIIDSIQTLVSPYIDSTPGSVSQVRECAGELQRLSLIHI